MEVVGLILNILQAAIQLLGIVLMVYYHRMPDRIATTTESVVVLVNRVGGTFRQCD